MNQKTGSQSGFSDAFDSKKRSSAPTQESSNEEISKEGTSSPMKEALLGGARDIGTEVQQMATDVAGEAKKAAESKLDAGRDFAAEHLGSVANALRKTSKELRASESGVTDYVDMAARGVERVSGYLQTRTLSQLIGDVEQYARREPAIFLGGAFFAGLLGGRFLKSATPSPSRDAGISQGARSTTPKRPRALPQSSAQQRAPETTPQSAQQARVATGPASNGPNAASQRASSTVSSQPRTDRDSKEPSRTPKGPGVS
jgi:hypothetical protein